VDGGLLAVVVYRKGARAIADMLLRGRKEAGDATWKRLLEIEMKAVEEPVARPDGGERGVA
jgi:hypothetical protein